MYKPAKLKSINNISIVWIEECSEVKYTGFKELIGRLRHPKLKLHMILSTNPVGEDNWSFKHFFKDELNKRFILDDNELYEERTIVLSDTYYHHSTADDKLFLPITYINELEEMKTYDPDLHRIARKGQFGVNGLTFDQKRKQVIYDMQITDIIGKKPVFVKYSMSLYNSTNHYGKHGRVSKRSGEWKGIAIRKGKKVSKAYKVTSTKFWMLSATATSAWSAKQIITRKDRTKSYLANKKVVLYPTVKNPDNKTTMPIPATTTYKWLPPNQRVKRTAEDYRDKYIKWYTKKYGAPKKFKWKDMHIHHLRPLNYGGNHSISNLYAVHKDVHTKKITPWWNNYNPPKK